MVRNKGLEPNKSGIIWYYMVSFEFTETLKFQRIEALSLDFADVRNIEFFQKWGTNGAQISHKKGAIFAPFRIAYYCNLLNMYAEAKQNTSQMSSP